MEDFGSPGGSFHANHAPPGTPPPPPTRASFLYVHRPWRYTLRASLALVPALAMLVGSGGGAILGTLLVGLMVVYVLDVLELAEAALLSAWCTLLAVYVAACAGSDLFDGRRSPAVSLLLLLVNGECLFLAGLCVTLQFRWVRVSFPGVTIAAERCVFAAAPLARAARPRRGPSSPRSAPRTAHSTSPASSPRSTAPSLSRRPPRSSRTAGPNPARR